MSSALIVGEALGADRGLEGVLRRFGVEELVRVAGIGEALELLPARHLDYVFIEADNLNEAHLGQLDRAVRRGRNTEIIGTAPQASPEVMLRAMRAGIQEFLVRPVPVADLTASMERITRRRATTTTTGSIFACYSSKGGVGVSSVSANLTGALAAAAPSRSVTIADFVIPGGEQKLLFNIAPVYDIGQAALRPDRLDQEFLNSVLSPARDRISLLASSDDPEVDDRVDAAVATSILNHLRSSFTCTVVDCERQLNDRTLAILDAADRILLITQLNVSALRTAQRSLTLFRRLGYPNSKLCVVINRFQSGEVLSVKDAEDLLKTEVFFRIPNDYKVMAESVARGQLAHELDAHSKVALAFAALASKLTGTAERPVGTNGHKPGGLRGLFSRKK